MGNNRVGESTASSNPPAKPGPPLPITRAEGMRLRAAVERILAMSLDVSSEKADGSLPLPSSCGLASDPK